jgi:hypothetical protein
MKRKLVYIPIIILIIGLVITFSFFINNAIILTRIYYKIDYRGNVQSIDNIIEKSELFDYEKYCKYRDDDGQVHNVSDGDNYYHIDRGFIESLIKKIENDKNRFHFYPFFRHSLEYSLEVTNEPLIYLTYNNNSIIKAEYENHTEIFAAWSSNYNGYVHWIGNWYLNFTHIPFAPNSSSTLKLNDIFLVKMNLQYQHSYYDSNSNVGEAEGLLIDQFLCFNSNFQLMFVYFPLRSKVLQ